jgi:hypothetical protein
VRKLRGYDSEEGQTIGTKYRLDMSRLDEGPRDWSMGQTDPNGDSAALVCKARRDGEVGGKDRRGIQFKTY